MIFRKSCPVRGLKMKMAPLMGLVVRLPSNVWERESRLDKYFEEAYVHQSENLITWTSKGTYLHIQKVQVYSMYRYTACTVLEAYVHS